MKFQKLKLFLSAILAVTAATTMGFTLRPTSTEAESTSITTIATQPEAPEVIYVTQIETVVVTEVVTEIVTEVQYVEYLPDDYDMVHEFYYLTEEKYNAHFTALMELYPEATTVWRMLTEKYALTPYVAAGIIGNMMNECGGNTLKLQPTLYGGYSKGYYGLCMWSASYHPDVQGKSLEEQVDYLMSNIQYIFDTYGKIYKVGFTYADFCSMTDVRAISDAFMVVYERPGPTTKTTRRNNALYAYSVFVQP